MIINFKKRGSKNFINLLIFLSIGFAQQSSHQYIEYQRIQNRLQQGWNTWNTSSVLQQVLLPQGFAINLAFKQHYFLEEQYLSNALIGRRGDFTETVRPGPHAYDGSYTQLEIQWEGLDARIETAHAGKDLVILKKQFRFDCKSFQSVYIRKCNTTTFN